MDGYRLTTLIDASKALLDLGEDLYEKATDIVNSWTEQQDKAQEAHPKEEREWR